MLSKAKIKYIQSLQQKKYRQREGLFLVEGEKIVEEVLHQQLFKVHSIYATDAWVNKNMTFATQYKAILTSISPAELKKISNLKTPNQIVALVEKAAHAPSAHQINQSLNLVLENIQDPGNMGTIIRIADWFGIPHIFCSKGCVDIYNSKVVQATMGSFLRTAVVYTDLDQLFDEHPLPIYGAVLGGENLFQSQLIEPSFLLIGNEGKGLSDAIQNRITHRITIPKTGQAESLNAAVATGILCAFFRQ